MDKQALKKHHFWILLALAIILIPVALGGAVFGVGGMAEEKTKKIDEKLIALNKQAPKSRSYQAALDEQKAELQTQKERVWKSAYEAQKGLIHWPSRLKSLNDLADKNTLYFGDHIDAADLATFRSPRVYMAEYNRLPEIIAPTDFADHSWQRVLQGRYVAPDWGLMPTPEEAWLALEDLCVEREVLHDIHAVNQMLAEFLPVPLPIQKPEQPKGKAKEELERYQQEMQRYTKENAAYLDEKKKIDETLAAEYKVRPNEVAGRFISPYWQLDVVVGRPAAGQAKAGELNFRGKLTNVSPRRQNVARIDFKVWLTNPNRTSDYAILPIQAEYLAANASVDFNETRQATSDSLKIQKVEQKLDAHYAPVKQLVKLELGYPSHRFADKGLVASAFSQEEINKTPPPPTNPATGGAPVPGGPGGQAPDTSMTPNHIPRLRYLERNEQVRRMPVGIVMIVDQGHVQDVIRALSNSRLRFQNTQIHYERFRGSISLDEPTGADEGRPAGFPPGVLVPPGSKGGDSASIPSRRMQPGGGRGEQRRGGGARGLPPPGHGDPNINPSVDEENNNLVELAVYGLISLYEQFPPKAPAGQAPGAAPTPAVQPTPSAPPPPPNVPVPPAAAPAGGLPPPVPAGPNPTANPPTPPAKPIAPAPG
jgi:hypothetical protein